jgi:hypothetical protein
MYTLARAGRFFGRTDKGIFKVMVANDIPVVDTLVVLRRKINRRTASKRNDERYPFTKPANLLLRRHHQVQQPL